MALGGTVIVEQTIGIYNPATSSEEATVNSYKNLVTLRSNAASTSAGSSLIQAVGTVRAKYVVTAVRFDTAATGITADDTNYATISVTKNDGANGARTTVASQTTKITGGSGNVATYSAVSIPVVVTLSANVIASGSELYINVAQTASGVIVPAAAWEIDLMPID